MCKQIIKYHYLRKILTLLFIVCCLNLYSQTSRNLDKFINAADNQTSNLKNDTSKIRGWSNELGNFEETIYIEFKTAKNNDLIRVVIENPGKEKILYYFKKGKLLGAKIEFSKKFNTWEGQVLVIRQPEPKPGEIILSSDDQSYQNVSQELALSGYGWKSYYQKMKQ